MEAHRKSEVFWHPKLSHNFIAPPYLPGVQHDAAARPLWVCTIYWGFSHLCYKDVAIILFKTRTSWKKDWLSNKCLVAGPPCHGRSICKVELHNAVIREMRQEWNEHKRNKAESERSSSTGYQTAQGIHNCVQTPDIAVLQKGASAREDIGM